MMSLLQIGLSLLLVMPTYFQILKIIIGKPLIVIIDEYDGYTTVLPTIIVGVFAILSVGCYLETYTPLKVQ